MDKMQDLYTTLLGVRSQIEKSEDTITTLQNLYKESFEKLSHNVESFDSQKDSILCTLKNLSEMISAFTEQQHQYVDHIRNYFKETSKDLDNSNNILQSIIKPVIQSVNKMSPLLAENIYSACDILRSDFDLLENHFGELFASKTCIPPVLTNKEHIRIFLMGEFSSGIDDFEKLYNKNTDWQDLIFDVQAFHWLRFSQGGSTVKKNYLLSVASPFISRIE